MTLTEFAQPTAQSAATITWGPADGSDTVVALRGEIDVLTLPVVVDVLARAIAGSDGPVVIDLSEIEFIDTGTVRTFVRAWQFLDGRGRTLTVRSPSRLAARVLGLLDLAHLIENRPGTARASTDLATAG